MGTVRALFVILASLTADVNKWLHSILKSAVLALTFDLPLGHERNSVSGNELKNKQPVRTAGHRQSQRSSFVRRMS